jgi:hypothetical protein
MAETDDAKLGKIIARAWSDASFKARLHSDLAGALREMGVEPPKNVKLHLIESDDRNAYFVLPPAPKDITDTQELRTRAVRYDYKPLVHVLYNVCCC